MIPKSPAPAFERLRGFIHSICGLALTPEKAYLMEQRLEPVARASGCGSLEEFEARLGQLDSSALRDMVIEAITTHETAFFRDGHPFEAFARDILPRLVEGVRQRRAASPFARGRLWCAAASTGQEAYSLAILLVEALGPEAARDFTILASDVSAKVLAKAVAGEYGERDLRRGLTDRQIERHFRKVGSRWSVGDEVRRLVEFQRVNLIHPFRALGVFDAILCRNALIYFNDATRRRIAEQFAEMLPPGGWLLLGAAENLYGVTSRFASERLGETLVYRAVGEAKERVV